MASSITLQSTTNVASIGIGQRPLTGVGGFANEPAFTFGNWVRNFILSPPFAWRWNRSVTSFTAVAGQQDYAIGIPTFGWLELATLYEASSSTTYEMEVALDLGDTQVQERPTKIAARLDNDNGTITFRLFPAPAAAYPIKISYQNASPNFANLTDTWAPIPDYFNHMFYTGFLAKCYEYIGDEKFANTMQLFIKFVVSASEGLTDSQKTLFLDAQLAVNRTLKSAQGGGQ